MALTNSYLHYVILKHIIEKGYAPSVKDIGIFTGYPSQAIEQVLYMIAWWTWRRVTSPSAPNLGHTPLFSGSH